MGMVGAEAEEGAVGFATNTTVNPVNLDEKVKLKEWLTVPAFGTYVLSTYMQLNPGSRSVAVVIRNGTSKAIHMASSRQIGRVITANTIPDPHTLPDLLKKLDEEEPVSTPGLSTAERQEKLLEILEGNGGLDGLKDWPPEVATNAHRLLPEFHSHIFSGTEWDGLYQHNRTCYWGHQ